MPSCLNYGEDPNVCIKGECELGCKILCPIEEKFLSHWGRQTNNSFESHFFLCFPIKFRGSIFKFSFKSPEVAVNVNLLCCDSLLLRMLKSDISFFPWEEKIYESICVWEIGPSVTKTSKAHDLDQQIRSAVKKHELRGIFSSKKILLQGFRIVTPLPWNMQRPENWEHRTDINSDFEENTKSFIVFPLAIFS